MSIIKRGPRLCGAENAIIREGVLAGKTAPVIEADLKAKGFNRAAHTLRGCNAWNEAMRDRKAGVRPALVTKSAASDRVVFDDLVIRREVRSVSFMTLNGIVRQVPVSLSAGVNWQGAA